MFPSPIGYMLTTFGLPLLKVVYSTYSSKWMVIFMKPWTSTGFFSSSVGSPFIVLDTMEKDGHDYECIWGIRESSREERGPSCCFSPMVRWFKTITILCLSCKVVVMYNVWNFSILMSYVHSWLYHSCVKEKCDISLLKTSFFFGVHIEKSIAREAPF